MALPKPLPGLMSASFRGVSFFVPEISSTHGRRIAAHYFPGIDYSSHDDHGLSASQINFEALYVGDDYIEHGNRLKRAFETSGPGTLIHPWFGAIQVILLEPAEISFSSTELRVVRISVSFEKVELTSLLFGATLPNLLDNVLNIVDTAMELIDFVDGFSLSRLKSDALARVATSFLSSWQTAQPKNKSYYNQKLNDGVPTSVTGFKGLINEISNKTIESTKTIGANSAVAPANGSTQQTPSAKPEEALEDFLKFNDTFSNNNKDYVSTSDKAFSLAVQGHHLGKALSLISDVDFQSRRQASNLRQKISVALNDYSNDLQSLFETVLSANASALYRAAQDAKIAAMSDINETIGRLPQTSTITVTRDTDAWALANQLYGDNPRLIEKGYLDLIQRNRIAHPALIQPMTLEILS